MRERLFEYGPLARGVYIALISCTAVVPFFSPGIFLYYILFLLFLGLGLRPLLEHTGLYHYLVSLQTGAGHKLGKKHMEKRRREIDMKVKNDTLRRQRARDIKLPKNW